MKHSTATTLLAKSFKSLPEEDILSLPDALLWSPAHVNVDSGGILQDVQLCTEFSVYVLLPSIQQPVLHLQTYQRAQPQALDQKECPGASAP